MERETLRVNNKGFTSLVPHQHALGSKLTHSKITTDYSENLLEFITGVHSSTDDLISELLDIHAFTSASIDEELLWPSSLPAEIPDENKIPLAYYGESNVGKLKTLYRKGLGYRYGRSMQSIAGIHYNFSLTDNFWEYYLKTAKSNLSLQDFKNEKYFALIRNYRRYSWVLTYLFGSSSVVHKSFLKGKDHNLTPLDSESFFTEEGTSLRMGGLGYTSSAQKDIGICYNQLSTYIKTIEKARLQSFAAYEKIGLEENGELKQLNTNLLQIDNEFYSTIRPKNIAKSKESALKALDQRGIEYIEVRLLDVNSHSNVGISKSQIEFLHIFLIWCLTSDSPEISQAECSEIDFNFNQIVKHGRRDELILRSKGRDVLKDDLLTSYFSEMKEIVSYLEKTEPGYSKSFKVEEDKLRNRSLLPSELAIAKIKEKGFLNFYLELAQKHKNSFTVSEQLMQKFSDYSSESHKAQAEMEANDKLEFRAFLKKYFDEIKVE